VKCKLTALVLLGIALIGCASKPKVTKKLEKRTVVYQRLSPADLRQTIEKKLELVKNFCATQVRVTIRSKLAPGGEQVLTGAMAIEFPDKLHLTLGKPHTFVRLDLIADGKNFWIVNHAQKVIYTGPMYGRLNEQAEKIRFKPVDICNIVFCRELTKQAGFERRLVFVEAIGNLYTIYVLRYDYPNKLYSKIWVDRHTLDIVGHQIYAPVDGEVVVDAVFGEYEVMGGLQMPHNITINWPRQGTTISLALKGIKINQRWQNPDLFKCEYLKKGFEIISLAAGELPPQAGPAGLQERPPTGAPPKGVAPWQRAYPRRFTPKRP